MLTGLQTRLIVAVLSLIGIGMLVLAGYATGHTRGTMDAEARHTKIYNKQQTLLREADAKNREQERTHEQHIADLRAEFARESAEARAADGRVMDDLRSGNRRLRLQVASCRGTPRPTPPGPSSGGVDEPGDAELAPATATALWAIAGDGDRAIRKLTALQDWAKSAVVLCNPKEND